MAAALPCLLKSSSQAVQVTTLLTSSPRCAFGGECDSPRTLKTRLTSLSDVEPVGLLGGNCPGELSRRASFVGALPVLDVRNVCSKLEPCVDGELSPGGASTRASTRPSTRASTQNWQWDSDANDSGDTSAEEENSPWSSPSPFCAESDEEADYASTCSDLEVLGSAISSPSKESFSHASGAPTLLGRSVARQTDAFSVIEDKMVPAVSSQQEAESLQAAEAARDAFRSRMRVIAGRRLGDRTVRSGHDGSPAQSSTFELSQTQVETENFHGTIAASQSLTDHADHDRASPLACLSSASFLSSLDSCSWPVDAPRLLGRVTAAQLAEVGEDNLGTQSERLPSAGATQRNEEMTEAARAAREAFMARMARRSGRRLA